MKTIFACLILIFISFPAFAKVVDLTGLPYEDDFINLGERICYRGTISLEIIDGVPYIKAFYVSKLPLGAAVDMYNKYLEANGAKGQMFLCPYCPLGYYKYVWFGILGEREKRVVIDYANRSGEIIINVYSDIDQNVFKNYKKTFMDNYIEFIDLAGNPSYYHETIKGKAMSTVLIYDIIDSPQKEIESAVRRLERFGWKNILGEIYTTPKNEKTTMLNKDGYNASVTCIGDQLFVSVVPYGSAL
jgi:hypothetical protein